jgi:hypothetical protein
VYRTTQARTHTCTHQHFAERGAVECRMHAEHRDRSHRRQNPTNSGPQPTVAGRSRATGKGPFSAVSPSTLGHFGTSATPSGTASNTHGGQASSSGMLAAYDARSTLPAMVRHNSDGTPVVAGLATTAAVGGASHGPGGTERRVRTCCPPQCFNHALFR